jgi:hypothetical protein
MNSFSLSYFIKTKTGKRIFSFLIGIGVATLFRTICKGPHCYQMISPPLDTIQNTIYKKEDKCYQYVFETQECNLTQQKIKMT